MKKFSPGIGSASLILIFSALCLAIFALLSLSSANREKALTEKFVSSTENYYAADSAAVEIAAQLRSAVSRGECPNKINDVNITTDGTSSFAYLCPIDAQRALSREGYAVLLSTHNPQHALMYADRILALRCGRAIANGPPEDTLTEELIKLLYGVDTRLVASDTGAALLLFTLPG